MNDPRFARLVTISGLIRDHRLALLTAAIARRDASVALRDGLVMPSVDDPAALQVQAAYGVWVDRKRDALAAQIACQNTEVGEEMHKARTAFARAQALQRLRDQLS